MTHTHTHTPVLFLSIHPCRFRIYLSPVRLFSCPHFPSFPSVLCCTQFISFLSVLCFSSSFIPVAKSPFKLVFFGQQKCVHSRDPNPAPPEPKKCGIHTGLITDLCSTSKKMKMKHLNEHINFSLGLYVSIRNILDIYDRLSSPLSENCIYIFSSRVKNRQREP